MIRDLVLMKLNAVGLRGAPRPDAVAGVRRHGARVALARAIALDPELIMYDEPFAGLDPISLGTAATPDPRAERRAAASPASWSRTTWTRPSASPTTWSSLANGTVRGAGHARRECASADPLVHQFVHARARRAGAFPLSRPHRLAQDFGVGLEARA